MWWFLLLAMAKQPEACLKEARVKIEKNQRAEEALRCAAKGGLAEGQYLLGRTILNTVAAEDEPHRFEGLAWVALAAKSGYKPAQRRWEVLVVDLSLEDLERVEQITKKLP